MEAAGKKLVARFRRRRTLRAGSLITTVFGDAIAPRGGSVWLGSLSELMAGLGINDRLVRTSVFRLAKDGWLQSTQIGRRSYYSLTAEGREQFEQATRRIYGEPRSEWNGHWCLLLLAGLDRDEREAVRRECGWLGFGPLSRDVLAHPAPYMSALDSTIERLQLAEQLVVLGGQVLRNDQAMRTLAQQSWNLDEIDKRYAGFVRRFQPLMATIESAADLSGKTAFLLRTLLIQEYRKILLRDPQLPAELLPERWNGRDAYALCRNLYRAVYAPAEVYLTATAETASGPLPAASADSATRFGGL